MGETRTPCRYVTGALKHFSTILSHADALNALLFLKILFMKALTFKEERIEKAEHSLQLFAYGRVWGRQHEQQAYILPRFPYVEFGKKRCNNYRTTPAFPTFGEITIHKKFIIRCCSSCHLKDQREQNGNEEHLKRRRLLVFLVSSGLFPTLPSVAKTKTKNPYDEKRLLEQNRRVQKENNAPDDFPSFVREGFEVKVVAPENYIKRDSGLILHDFEVGKGDCPKAGQQVTFHYVGYNESGRRIDSSYLQGTPAKIRLGTNALVPGFEEGISDMKPGGKRRIIIPPELGPPVGPSTFFSSKQFEVFDVELLGVKDCTRRTIAFYSDVVCD